MDLVRTGARQVRLYLDITFLFRNELDIETFVNGKTFTAKIVDDLLNYANEKYRLIFDEFDTPQEVYVVEDCVVMVYEKRNQIYFE